jgi:ribosomal protein S6--L-glutamate ligase
MAARRKVARERRAPTRSKRPRADGALTLAILSRKSSLYTTRRMVEAGRVLGHDVQVLDTLRCDTSSACGLPVHGGREVEHRRVLPRIGASITGLGLATDGRARAHLSRSPGRATIRSRAAAGALRDRRAPHELMRLA